MAMFGGGDLAAKLQWLGPGGTSEKAKLPSQELELRDRNSVSMLLGTGTRRS